jgi:hypothetical protein
MPPWGELDGHALRLQSHECLRHREPERRLRVLELVDECAVSRQLAQCAAHHEQGEPVQRVAALPVSREVVDRQREM